MTISTTTSRAAYAGNGVTTIFSFPYRFLVNGDLEVTLFAADGTSTLKVLTTDYTVLGADDDAGGSVTMLVAPAVGETLVVRRVVDLTQETDYSSGDAFPAETHERALDKLTMMDQQLQEQVDRAVTVPVDNDTFSGELPMIVASKFLRVNDAGTALELVDAVTPGDLVVSPFIETLLDDANAAAARVTLGAQVAGNYATSGANSNITSLSGLTTALSIAQGGTGQITAAAAFGALKQAASETATGVVELATSAEAQAGTDTTRAITAAGMAASLFGAGQSWVDRTGVRSANTDFTNSTTKPRMVSISASNAGSATHSIIVGGVTIGQFGMSPSGNTNCLTAIVPPGVTYRYSVSSGSLLGLVWCELG